MESGNDPWCLARAIEAAKMVLSGLFSIFFVFYVVVLLFNIVCSIILFVCLVNIV